MLKKKKKKRNHILGKAWDFIAFSTPTLIRKTRKPLFAKNKLLWFKKQTNNKTTSLSYRFIAAEYEFSPSDTPLFICARSLRKKRNKFLSLLCAGAIIEKSYRTDNSFGRGDLDEDEVEILAVDQNKSEKSSVGCGEQEDEVSIDKKAEKFIERFYEKLRLQRQESLLQYEDMLLRSCS